MVVVVRSDGDVVGSEAGPSNYERALAAGLGHRELQTRKGMNSYISCLWEAPLTDIRTLRSLLDDRVNPAPQSIREVLHLLLCREPHSAHEPNP